MKRELIFLNLLFFTIAYPLQYIESSSGLIPPTLEGGRTELEMVDINNDGKLDLLSIGDHGSPYVNTDEHGIMVWFGDGRGNWSVYMNGDFGYGGIAIGDVNNDGYLDCGYGMHHNYSGNDFGDQVMEVALGDGTGRNWIPWDDSLGTHGQDWGMFGTDFADIDNDGYLDVGAVSFGADDGIHIYLNLRNGTWRRSFGFLGGNSYDEFSFGDVNRDGKVDFCATHQSGSVYFGDGQGNFILAHRNLPSPGSIAYRSVAFGDVDNDGGKDLGFINPQGGVMVFKFNVVGDTWVNLSGNLPATGNFYRIDLFDMNVDGFCDIVAQGNCTLKIWLGTGGGTWQETVRIITPPEGYGQALRVGGDCDNNGYPDIALVLREGSWPNARNRFRFFKETSEPSQLVINPIFPKGGERFYAGSANFIRWLSAVPNYQNSTVKIEFSSTGRNGPWLTIFDNLPNNGFKQWQIPNFPSESCYLRFWVFTSSETVSVITPRPFTILGSVGILTSPLSRLLRETPPVIFLRKKENLRISLPQFFSGKVKVEIYTREGRMISSEEKKIEGKEFVLNDRLGAGLYFFSLSSPSLQRKGKIIITP
ncbi:MAG: FG-GAP-like repeat-containing protein [candidate division WOR-3 bacterium]